MMMPTRELERQLGCGVFRFFLFPGEQKGTNNGNNLTPLVIDIQARPSSLGHGEKEEGHASAPTTKPPPQALWWSTLTGRV